jgi:hypothetical protein
MDVQNLSLGQAEAEAIRLATPLVASWNPPLIGASPATRSLVELAEQTGAIPLHWQVLYATEFEGAVRVLVNLSEESAVIEARGT